MSITKKILASIVAVSTIVSSFVTMTVFAANPTMKGTLLTSDYLFGDEGPFFTATAGSGVEISFEGLDKNIDYLDFEIKIPKDLKVEVTEGSGKKQTHPLRDITVDNLDQAIDASVSFTIYDRSAQDSDFYKYYLQFVNNTAEGWDGSSFMMYFGSTDEDTPEAYNVKTGSFDIENVRFGYLGDTGYTPVTVVQATKAAPTTYAVTTATTENGTVAVDKETASEGETVTITTTPDAGYEVATVKAGDAEVTGADNTYKFTMPAKAVEVAVTFKAKTVVDTNAAEKLGDYAEGANDNAVAFKKVFDANSLAGKTLMKLTATINGVARVYKGAPVAIPNVDGELKLGVVIQYKDAAVNVESLAIELQ